MISNSKAVKHKNMALADKIAFLEKLNDDGVNLKEIPDDYITEDRIIVKNVICNILKAYEKDIMSVKQIIKCEELGISFKASEDTQAEIGFLGKALNEGINFADYTCGDKSETESLISTYIKDIREKYTNSELDASQIYTCADGLKIIIPKEDLKNAVYNKIKTTAYRNILLCDDIT